MENEKNIPVAHHLCYVKFWWFSVRIAKWDLFFIKKNQKTSMQNLSFQTSEIIWSMLENSSLLHMWVKRDA